MVKDRFTLKDFYCVIVVYNKNLKDSITYNSLINVDGINIIVCDNSTNDFKNEDFLKDSGVTYFNMKGNKGISKAYNSAIECIKKKRGFICLFDDDTDVPNDYFKALISRVNEDNADIFLPIVYDEVGILSPCKINRFKVNRIKNLNELNSKNITGINSGMAINLEIFEDYRYDENYFLDYIDHDFLRSMKLKNKKISIFNAKLNQNFSGKDFSDLNSSLNRFKIYKEDFRYFYSKNLKSKIFANLDILKRQCYLSFKFKSLKFLI